jgi:hypothetical protein
MFWSKKHFEFKDIPDLSGKTAIITGANTGVSSDTTLQNKNLTLYLCNWIDRPGMRYRNGEERVPHVN